MKSEELDAIEARARAASPAPWKAVLLNDETDRSTVENVAGDSLFGFVDVLEEAIRDREGREPDWQGKEPGEDGCDDWTWTDGQLQVHADLRFAAEARADVPKLLEEVRRLSACVALAKAENAALAVAAEREACAALVSRLWVEAHEKSAHPCEYIVTAIRARGAL